MKNIFLLFLLLCVMKVGAQTKDTVEYEGATYEIVIVQNPEWMNDSMTYVDFITQAMLTDNLSIAPVEDEEFLDRLFQRCKDVALGKGIGAPVYVTTKAFRGEVTLSDTVLYLNYVNPPSLTAMTEGMVGQEPIGHTHGEDSKLISWAGKDAYWMFLRLVE